MLSSRVACSLVMEPAQNYCSNDFLVTVIFQPHSEDETVLLAVFQYFQGSIIFCFLLVRASVTKEADAMR